MNTRFINLSAKKKIKQKYFWLLILFIVLIFYVVPKSNARNPSPAELESIQKETKEVFENFLQLWQEERYFELYKFGKKHSTEQLTIEEFATRMVELDWVPLGLAPEHEPQISYRYKTFLYVKASIVFQHKNYSDLQFKKQHFFLIMKEKGEWRFDLIQMIRSPFYSSLR